MNADYVPQVGDRVRMRQWGPGRWVDVVAIERGYLFGFGEQDYAETLTVAHDWIKVIPSPTYPERWISVYSNGLGAGYVSRQTADNTAFSDRIAVIHLAADGTVTLHPVEVDQRCDDEQAAADILDAIDALHQPIGKPAGCCSCWKSWPCPTAHLLHPVERES